MKQCCIPLLRATAVEDTGSHHGVPLRMASDRPLFRPLFRPQIGPQKGVFKGSKRPFGTPY